MAYATHLQCTECEASYPLDRPRDVCECGAILSAQYDLPKARRELDRDRIAASGQTLWKYRDLLPAADPDNAVTLGEGGTPLISVPRLGEELGVCHLYLKDEGCNPTGTFKARGSSVAMTRARELGIRHLIMASSGNAAHAGATYAARGGLSMHLVVPGDAREMNLKGCGVVGADIYMVDDEHGPVTGVAKDLAHRNEWFDVSKDCYRTEGKKTIGYEIAEQLGWKVPDVVLYPTGGAVGPTALWKAFLEMAELGWTDGRLPRLVVVQSEGCHPVAKALREGKPLERWPDPHGIANGILNPFPAWGDTVMTAVRDTGGTSAVVSNGEIVEGMRLLASREGVLACPEGSATVPAAAQLRRSGFIGPEDVVVLVNTGSGLKYPQLIEEPPMRHMTRDGRFVGVAQ